MSFSGSLFSAPSPDLPDLTTTAQELEIISATLASDYPTSHEYLTSSYISCVSSQVYSKDVSIRRPVEYTTQKLLDLLEWRDESGATRVPEFISLARRYTSPLPSPSDDKITTQLSAALNKNAMYVHGYSKLGMPIVWLRTDRKPWFVKDVQSEILASSGPPWPPPR